MKKLKNLNNAALFLIIVFYIAILAVILILITPNRDYSVKPDYQHLTSYSEVTGYYQVRHVFGYSSSKLSETIVTKYCITSNKSESDLSDNNLSIIRAAVSTRTEKKANYFYNEQTNTQTPKNVSSSLTLTNDPTNAYFLVRYFDGSGNEQKITFKEDLFTTPKNSRRFNEYNKLNFDEESFIFQATKDVQENDKSISMQIRTTAQDSYHIDMQTWIETEDGSIYKFIGVYGYSEGYNAKGSNWYTNNETLPYQMKAENLLCKMVVTYKGQSREILYKVAISDLTSSFSNDGISGPWQH